MKILDTKTDISHAQKIFANLLRPLTTDTIPVSIGYQSGNFETSVMWVQSLGIWAYFGFPPSEKSPGNRYWNVFGIGKPSGQVSIVCEINPPVDGINRQAAGVFARSAAGEVFLMHRGIFNARGRISKGFVRKNFQGIWIDVTDRNKISNVIQVGELLSPRFPKLLCNFIEEAHRVKELARSSYFPS